MQKDYNTSHQEATIKFEGQNFNNFKNDKYSSTSETETLYSCASSEKRVSSAKSLVEEGRTSGIDPSVLQINEVTLPDHLLRKQPGSAQTSIISSRQLLMENDTCQSAALSSVNNLPNSIDSSVLPRNTGKNLQSSHSIAEMQFSTHLGETFHTQMATSMDSQKLLVHVMRNGLELSQSSSSIGTDKISICSGESCLSGHSNASFKTCYSTFSAIERENKYLEAKPFPVAQDFNENIKHRLCSNISIQQASKNSMRSSGELFNFSKAETTKTIIKAESPHVSATSTCTDNAFQHETLDQFDTELLYPFQDNHLKDSSIVKTSDLEDEVDEDSQYNVREVVKSELSDVGNSWFMLPELANLRKSSSLLSSDNCIDHSPLSECILNMLKKLALDTERKEEYMQKMEVPTKTSSRSFHKSIDKKSNVRFLRSHSCSLIQSKKSLNLPARSHSCSPIQSMKSLDLFVRPASLPAESFASLTKHMKDLKLLPSQIHAKKSEVRQSNKKKRQKNRGCARLKAKLQKMATSIKKKINCALKNCVDR